MFALNTPPRIAPFGMDALPVNPYIDIEFLVDGEQYFPRVAEALLQAKEEVSIEERNNPIFYSIPTTYWLFAFCFFWFFFNRFLLVDGV